jgi:hypothetical protein
MKRARKKKTVEVDSSKNPVVAEGLGAAAAACSREDQKPELSNRAEKIGKAGSLKQAVAMMAAAGVTISLEILKAAKNAGCPGFDDHHRVDCDLVREWLEDARNSQLMDSPTARKAMAEARHEELKVERIEYRNGVEQGKYSEKRNIADRLLRLAADQVTNLRQKLENEYPATVFGKSVEEIREEGRKLVDLLHGQMQLLVREWCEEK